MAIAVLIVVGAGVLRAMPLTAALPYSSYVDEGYVLRPAAHMVAERTWDPGWYGYPSLLISASAATTAAYDLMADDVRNGARDADAATGYNVVGPPALIVASRLLVLLSSMGTVLVTLLLAARLAGRSVGLVAGALVALTPALVSRSAIAIVDTPATFFAMASMLFASGFGSQRGSRWLAVGAGACAGLAATSKYPAAAVIVVALTVIGFQSTFSVRRKLAHVAFTLGAGVTAAVMAMPALVLRRDAVVDALSAQSEVYAKKTTETSYVQQLVSPAEVGWWLLVPSCVGVTMLLRRPLSRSVTVGWLLFVAILAVVVSRSQFQPFRNLLPITPFLAIAAAAALAEGARYASKLLGGSPQQRRLRSGGLLAVASGLVVVALFIGGVQPHLAAQTGLVDSRTAAVDWLIDEAEPHHRIFVASELVVAQADLDRVPGDVVVSGTGGDEGLPDLSDFDFIVTGVFKGQWAPPVPDGPPVAVFGGSRVQNAPSLWRGVDQVIQIRRGAAAAP